MTGICRLWSTYASVPRAAKKITTKNDRQSVVELPSKVGNGRITAVFSSWEPRSQYQSGLRTKIATTSALRSAGMPIRAFQKEFGSTR